MTKKEYLDQLGEALGGMSYAEVKDIIAEIDEHFEQGISAGKTEEEIANGLGSAKELAALYMDGNEDKIATALNKTKKEAPAKDPNDAIWGKLFVIFFNIFVGIPLWFALLMVLICGIGIELAIIAFIIWFATVIPAAGAFLASAILLEISCLLFAVFGFCLLWFPVKYFFIGTGEYIKWNRKLWGEGF